MAHPGGGAEQWHYIDRHNKEYGPFDTATMLSWFRQGLFHPIGTELLVRLVQWKSHVPVRDLYPADSIFVGPPRAAGGPPAAAPQGPPRDRSRSRGAARQPTSLAVVPAHGPPPAPAPAPAPPPQAHGPPPAYGPPPAHWPPAQHGPPPPHAYPPPYYPYAPPPYGYAAPPPGPYYAPPPYSGPPPRHGRHHGRVKSYNDRHGYGFIENVELHREHGRDVFVHKSELGDCQVGDEVTFSCELNKDGKPQARDLRPLHDGRSAAPPRMLPPDGYTPPGADAKKGVRRKAKAKAKSKPGRTSQTRAMLKAMAEKILPPRTKEQTAVRLDKSLDELIQEDRGPQRAAAQAAAGAQPAPSAPPAAAQKPVGGAGGSAPAALDMPLDALVTK